MSGGNAILGGTATAVILGFGTIIVSVFYGNDIGLSWGQRLLADGIGAVLIIGGLKFSSV